MSAETRIHVLGPLRVLIDGDDRTDRLSGPQRTLLAVLAGSSGPVERHRLRAAAGLAASSIDAELSRIQSRLGSSRHLHRSRTPTAGWVALDPAVRVDLDEAERLLARAEGGAPTASADLERVEEWWDAPIPDVVDAGSPPGLDVPALVDEVRTRAWRVRHRQIELAVVASRSPANLHPARTGRWAADHPACVPARLLHVEVLARRVGASAADEELEHWIRSGAPVEGADAGRAIIDRIAAEAPPLDPIGSVIAAARRGLDRLEHRTVSEVLESLRSATEGHDRWRVLLTRADAMRLGARWDEAELEFRAALAEAEKLGDHDAAAETLLAVARIVWQPGQLAQLVEARPGG